jgi:hypothetical protein
MIGTRIHEDEHHSDHCPGHLGATRYLPLPEGKVSESRCSVKSVVDVAVSIIVAITPLCLGIMAFIQWYLSRKLALIIATQELLHKGQEEIHGLVNNNHQAALAEINRLVALNPHAVQQPDAHTAESRTRIGDQSPAV